jgi:uncharacterized integral membrane protein
MNKDSRVKLVVALIFALLTLIVILQNTTPVKTRFLFISITMPNAALLGLTLLIGIAIGIIIARVLSGKREPKK